MYPGEEQPMLRSKVTRKYQTTLPSGLRKALGLNPGDEVGYIIEGDHAILVNAAAEGQDPALGAFLELLERDLRENPGRIKGIAPALVERVRALTDGYTVDLDEPIQGPVSL